MRSCNGRLHSGERTGLRRRSIRTRRSCDAEIKIGQTSISYEPASAYGTSSARWKPPISRMINEHGGIKGRKITLISLDDGSSRRRRWNRPADSLNKTTCWASSTASELPQMRRSRQYLNENHVPHFAISGATRFNDPTHFPWTMGRDCELRDRR